MRGMPPLSRRALLVGLAVTATGRRAHAQPKVFLDYDQDALDRAYDQRAWAPNMDAVLTRYVVPDFATVMEVGLDGMVAQVRRAVAWVAKHASSFGGDPGRIYVAGHSSGGHLAGTVLVTDWSTDFGLPRDVVKGGVCISGM